MGQESKAWGSVIAFWLALAGLAKKAQTTLNDWDWEIGPARAYKLAIMAIEHCIDSGLPSHNQPAWTMLLELYRERAASLEGSAIDLQLTQKMTGWRDFDIWAGTPSPHPMFPATGPLFDHVAAYNMIEPLIKRAAGALEAELEDRDTDILGRALTTGEAANVVWAPVRMMLDKPAFQMPNPQVPKWTMPFPWLSFVEKEMRQLKDELRGGQPTFTSGKVGDTPFSWPGQ